METSKSKQKEKHLVYNIILKVFIFEKRTLILICMFYSRNILIFKEIYWYSKDKIIERIKSVKTIVYKCVILLQLDIIVNIKCKFNY